jgi:hypothetical protein
MSAAASGAMDDASTTAASVNEDRHDSDSVAFRMPLPHNKKRLEEELAVSAELKQELVQGCIKLIPLMDYGRYELIIFTSDLVIICF